MGGADHIEPRLLKEEGVPALHGIGCGVSYKGKVLVPVDAGKQRGAFAVDQKPPAAVHRNGADPDGSFHTVGKLPAQNHGRFQAVQIRVIQIPQLRAADRKLLPDLKVRSGAQPDNGILRRRLLPFRVIKGCAQRDGSMGLSLVSEVGFDLDLRAFL